MSMSVLMPSLRARWKTLAERAVLTAASYAGSPAQGVLSDGAGDVREQLAAMEEALGSLRSENRELRAAVLHSRSTYDSAAALAGKVAALQQRVRGRSGEYVWRDERKIRR